MSSFGARVIGEDAAAAALAAQKGGGEVFGKRVIGEIPIPTGENVAKGASQFGAAVIGQAHETGPKGNPGSASVEEIENMLEENPTFFDSLYEAELARKEGPRRQALEIFLVVEYGIKGAGRQSVIQEIRGMLGHTAITAKQAGNDLTARVKALDARQERMDENALLDDAVRVRALRDREDNLNALKNPKNRGTANQLGSISEETQVRSIAKEEKLDIGGESAKPGEPILPRGVAAVSDEGGKGRGPHTDLAADDVKPESQTTAPRSSQKKKGSSRKK